MVAFPKVTVASNNKAACSHIHSTEWNHFLISYSSIEKVISQRSICMALVAVPNHRVPQRHLLNLTFTSCGDIILPHFPNQNSSESLALQLDSCTISRLRAVKERCPKEWSQGYVPSWQSQLRYFL